MHFILLDLEPEAPSLKVTSANKPHYLSLRSKFLLSAKNKWGKIHTGIGTRARILFFFIDQKGRERKKIRRNLITNREKKKKK